MKKKKLLSILALLLMAAAGAWAQGTVTVKEGTEDADKWTITPNPATEGQTVTVTYTGTKKVKSITAVVKAAKGPVDLSTLTANYEAQDGDVLTGTLAGDYKISIAAGATVTLKDADINGSHTWNSDYAGITCMGNATIILDGTNTVKGFYMDYPGIQVGPTGTTLTIQGDGSLNVSSGGWSAGIGGGDWTDCGNITITSGVTSVTASKGADAPNSIGAGYKGSCGTVTIGGVVGAISESPYTYDPSASAEITVTLTPSQIGNLNGDSNSYTSTEGITIAVSGDCSLSSYGYLYCNNGTVTFSTSTGNIKKIEINHSEYGDWSAEGSTSGWATEFDNYTADYGGTFTWSGTPAASVMLKGEMSALEAIASIVFTIE